MKFKAIWFQGVAGKEKQDLQQSLMYSPIRERLLEIVQGFLDEVERPSRKDYDNPSWAYKQAHMNGEILAYQKILEILRPEG